MLEIAIPGLSFYNEATAEFIDAKGQVLQLEHSLVSIAKWESKWHKPFLGKDEKTRHEALDYIQCMTINKGVDPIIYSAIPQTELDKVNAYLEDSMTATWFNERQKAAPSRDIITNEVIYYWMVSLQIPFDPCEKWHLNRLLTLIRVCNLKNAPAKKMSKRELMSQNQAINAARKQKLNTHG